MKARMTLWKIRRGVAKGLQRLGSRLDLRLRIVPGVMAGDLAPQFFVNGVMVSEAEAVELGLWFGPQGNTTFGKLFARFGGDHREGLTTCGGGGGGGGSYTPAPQIEMPRSVTVWIGDGGLSAKTHDDQPLFTASGTWAKPAGCAADQMVPILTLSDDLVLVADSPEKASAIRSIEQALMQFGVRIPASWERPATQSRGEEDAE